MAMDVQAAKSLVEEDAYAPRGFQDDEATISEQRELERVSHDAAEYDRSRKGKRRASLDVEGGDDREGTRSLLYGRENGHGAVEMSDLGKGRKHVHYAEDGEEGTVRRSAESGSERPRRGRLSKRARRRVYWRDAMINVLFILSWYLFATLISLYNKWMFSAEHFGFEFPLFVTTFHMAIQFILAGLTLVIFSHLRPNVRPSRRDYVTKAAPCGVATGVDIGLSNNSLKLVTLSFYTMCKSSTLAFVLLFAFLFRLEKPTWRLIAIIALITCGVVLMVSTETQFNFWGMIEVLAASCMGGLRWSLTQLLLEKEKMGMGNPIATIFWLAPVMGSTLAVCSLLFEGWGQVLAQERFFGDLGASMRTMAFILLPGVLAFLMNVSEFALIKRTSVVTLSIAGIFKEVLTIFLSTMVFGDVMTPLNISGLIVTVLGIALYNVLKYNQSMKSPAADAAKSTGLTDVGITLDQGVLPLAKTRLGSEGPEDETYFLADGTSYTHPRERPDDDDDDSYSDSDPAVNYHPEPVNPHPVDHLEEQIHNDPEQRRLDRDEAKLEGILEANLHHKNGGTPRAVETGEHHVLGEDEEDDWGKGWEVDETGNGLVIPDEDGKKAR